MPEDPKTVAIDTSEVLARQRATGNDDSDIPKTVAIDSEQLARRIESAKREANATPKGTGIAKRWFLLAAIAILALVAYLLV